MALPHHASGETRGIEAQKLVGAKGLEGENDPGGNVRRVPETTQCETATTNGGEKTSYGHREVEGIAASKICHTCRVKATQKV